MDNYIDLHIHSNYSADGEESPAQLVQRCKEAGVRIMAISDHNTIGANKEAKEEAEKVGIKYIPAIEIDCILRDKPLHVLGYGIDYESPDFKEIEDNLIRQRQSSNLKRLELTRKLGFEIEQGELGDINELWTSKAFGEILFSKEQYKDNQMLAPYRPGGSRSDSPLINFVWDFYAKGRPCYVEVSFPTFEETLRIIHRNGGIAVLAHPGQNLGDNTACLDEMGLLGLDGVEAFSGYHGEAMARLWYDKAKSLNMIITCGSDYHGEYKPNIKLGQTGCFIDLKEIEQKINF